MDSVVSEMKSLDDATLTTFQQGETLKVKGYDITTDDMSLKYATVSENSGTQDKKYEAHSDGEVHLSSYLLVYHRNPHARFWGNLRSCFKIFNMVV